jgi:hypothetical protein
MDKESMTNPGVECAVADDADRVNRLLMKDDELGVDGNGMELHEDEENAPWARLKHFGLHRSS